MHKNFMHVTGLATAYDLKGAWRNFLRPGFTICNYPKLCNMQKLTQTSISRRGQEKAHNWPKLPMSNFC